MNSRKRKNPLGPKKGPSDRHSDRPRGFPPPPNLASGEPQSSPPSGPAADSNWESYGRTNDLSDHPAFQNPDSAQLPPASGYIPPGQGAPNSGQPDAGYPSGASGTQPWQSDNQQSDRQPSDMGYTDMRQSEARDPQTWDPQPRESDARFAPPVARPPQSNQPGYQHPQPQSGPAGSAFSQPNALPDYRQPSYDQARYDQSHQDQSQYNPSRGHDQEHQPPGYDQRGQEQRGHDQRGYAQPNARPPARMPDTAPNERQRSSTGRTILKILAWTAALAMIMTGLVLGGGLWTFRNMATQLLNPNTQQTFVTKAPVVASLKQVNKQIMIEHNNMVDIDYREAPEGWLALLPIEQSFVVLLRGRVPAGFDLSDLSDDDVWISNDGSKIRLVLPPPMIFEENVSVNFEESRVVSEGDTCPNFICAQDLDAIQQTIIPQGRQLLIETSYESGIMEQAAELGIAYYESLLKSLGFEEIQVFIRSDVEIIQSTE